MRAPLTMRLAAYTMVAGAVIICIAAFRVEFAAAIAAGEQVRLRHQHAGHATASRVGVRAQDGAAARDSVVVTADGPVSISDALAAVRAQGLVIIAAGVHAVPATIVVTRPVRITGEPRAVLDGSGGGTILEVAADSVIITGLTFRNVAVSHVEDHAAIRLRGATHCTVAANRVENAFFGIYLDNAEDCQIRDNDVHGNATTEATSGNGIHLWSSRRVRIANNRISGHRDGIYLEFVHGADVQSNTSTRNVRYGLHFMYSNDSRYEGNTFRTNGAGVAVMYTKGVTMRRNRFEQNWGAATYGLLLKDIVDSRVDSNLFERNTVALQADGATRLGADANVFRSNGWAIRLGANTENASFTGNAFEQNTFDVASTSGQHTTRFRGNYWDNYRGYDLDRDGVGDVPHHPVRLFSLLVERDEPSLVMLRSGFVALLDAAERVLPSLTPTTLADSEPVMRIRR